MYYCVGTRKTSFSVYRMAYRVPEESEIMPPAFVNLPVMQTSLWSLCHSTTAFAAASSNTELVAHNAVTTQSELVGQALHHQGYKSGSFLFVGEFDLLENGKLAFRTDWIKAVSGAWRIAGDNLSVALDVLRARAKNCKGLLRISDNKFQTSGGYVLEMI